MIANPPILRFVIASLMIAIGTSHANAQQFRQPGRASQPGGYEPAPLYRTAAAPPSIPVAAQPQPAVEGDTGDAEESSGGVMAWISSFKSQVLAGGPLMIPLGVCCLIVIGLIGERMLSMRRGRVIPRPFVRRFREKVEDGGLDIDEGIEICDEFDCAVADVFAAAIKRSGRPMVEIEAAVFDALERAQGGLRRYLRMFHAISNVAPLLGLLGTVLGMIEAFKTMAADSGIGKPDLLASGISQALLTTAGGLTVAIPAYLAYMYFSSRADRYLAEIESLSLTVIEAVAADSGSGTKSRKRRAA